MIIYLETPPSTTDYSGRGGSGGYGGYGGYGGGYGGGIYVGKRKWGIKKEETAFTPRYIKNVEDFWQLIHHIYISVCYVSWNFISVVFLDLESKSVINGTHLKGSYGKMTPVTIYELKIEIFDRRPIFAE